MTDATAETAEAPLALVADDDAGMRELVSEVLEQAGFRTVTAADGAEAVELALKQPPRLIVLDLMMPHVDGYTAVARLRGHPSTRDTPVIILTGQNESVYQDLSVGMGAVAHVTKPFSPVRLLETVRRILAEREARPGEDRELRDGTRPESAETRAEAADPPSAGLERAGRGTPATAVDMPGDATGIAQVYALLLAALRDDASELHVEPLADGIRVRNRVQGRLRERAPLPRTALDAVIGRFRRLAGLSDEDHRHAYVRTRLEEQDVELELVFLPTLHGEAVTVRLWRQGLADLDAVLGAAVTRDASDVYLLEGTPPVLKIHGVATPLEGASPLIQADLRKLLLLLVPEDTRKEFEATGEADLSYAHPRLGRFRLNCYRAMGSTGMVLRRVKTEVPTFEALDLPPLLGTLVLERQGLILIVGATGSGKSTTLAAMIDHRNAHAPGHIITIEDPVEFIHTRKSSVISQREVGIDTESYLIALQKALRQAPDVILVGELRDRETVAVALHAAETGHLVLSTLHATNATGAIERLVNFFPPDARASTLMQLSLMLRAIIAQRLVPHADGTGRVAALEIMLNTSRMQTLIRRGELEQIGHAIEEGIRDGLQTLDQALLALYLQEKITQEDALRFADSPQNLRLRLKGIR